MVKKNDTSITCITPRPLPVLQPNYYLPLTKMDKMWQVYVF